MSDCLVRDYRAPIETSSFYFIFYFFRFHRPRTCPELCVCVPGNSIPALLFGFFPLILVSFPRY
jgi:hypothetical protein